MKSKGKLEHGRVKGKSKELGTEGKTGRDSAAMEKGIRSKAEPRKSMNWNVKIKNEDDMEDNKVKKIKPRSKPSHNKKERKRGKGHVPEEYLETDSKNADRK